ncbi:MAG: ribosome maturation factor RimM, partial [Candidatus Binataceae bacterium]
FYYFQAIGCDVITTGGQALGQIEEIFSNGANDIMVVRDGKSELLIPVIADVIRAIELEQRRIIIEPIPGLLD